MTSIALNSNPQCPGACQWPTKAHDKNELTHHSSLLLAIWGKQRPRPSFGACSFATTGARSRRSMRLDFGRFACRERAEGSACATGSGLG
jgi:hypothetical protein